MSTTNGGSAMDPATNVAPPQLMVLGQYIKDLSFENPNAPGSLQAQTTQPQINVSVNVTANPMSDTDIEVVLRLEGKAENNAVMFHIELEFAGVFRVQNVPPEQVQPLVLIECPRLLFPFAREIIATTVRNGGFPPLMLDPIDFLALYQQRLSQQAAQQPSA